jgi:hypothetical protein
MCFSWRGEELRVGPESGLKERLDWRRAPHFRLLIALADQNFSPHCRNST